MAAKNGATTKLVIKVVAGTTAAGKTQYANRTFQHIAPEVTDKDAYAIGTALGALQSRTVGAINRIDSADLVSE